MKTASLPRLFTGSAGTLLLAAALMLLLANLGNSGLVLPHDPVFEISMRSLFWGVGPAALGVALICLFGKSTWWQLIVLLWTGVNLLVYQWGAYFQTQHPGLNGYFDILGNAFHLSGAATDWMVKFATGGLIVGSLLSLLSLWAMARNTLKVYCPNCGGHVQFSIKAVGSKVPCPHCQKIMTLQQAENLKISCCFCQGHIEFPAHALGEKIPCPHCKMDITLKEPA